MPDLAQGVSMKYIYPDLPAYKPMQMDSIKTQNNDVRNQSFQ